MLLATFARGVWKFGFLVQNSPDDFWKLEESLAKSPVVETFWNGSGSYVVLQGQKRQANSSREVNLQELLTCSWYVQKSLCFVAHIMSDR